jgi:pyruvate dehydrogenase E1 component
MGEVVDGQYQRYATESGRFIRDDFFGASPELRALVKHLSDQELKKLNRGGHDPVKVYAAYRAAVEHEGAPTVILAKTIKGYGLGEAGAGRNITHKQKKLNEEELLAFRDRFDIPISDEQVGDAPFFRPDEDSPEIKYLHQQRRKLGGYLPHRRDESPPLEIPELQTFSPLLEQHDSSTTMAFGRILYTLLKDKQLGPRCVPIIPDEARTFGLETLFGRCGIYSSKGQLYEPVDADQLIHYKEARDGQILEEGITEAGSMASFIAAGTSYSTLGLPMIPFYLFYSMFGFQRVGDLVWAAADSRAKGFLLGCTAGRTTLNGEGLQHQDGHSPLAASTVPNLRSYDPGYVYEAAVIVREGLRRMYTEQKSEFYYLTLYNESYESPEMPEGVTKDIMRGMHHVARVDAESHSTGHKQKKGGKKSKVPRPQLLASGSLLPHAAQAQDLLAERFGVSSDLWSVTSFCQLRRDALEVERWNRLHPEEQPRRSFLEERLEGVEGPLVGVSDYMKAVPDQIARWVPGPWISLGTDGFGRSDTRAKLRDHYEVDARHIALAALTGLARQSNYSRKRLREAISDLEIAPDKVPPAQC